MITYRKLLLLSFCCSLSAVVFSQDVTVYSSPYKKDQTLTRVIESIEKNGFSFLNTSSYKRGVSTKKSEMNAVQIVYFETEDVAELAACEPTAMLEMPLKLIIWNEGKNAFIGYTNPNHFKKRYLVTTCDEVIKNLNRALIRVVNDAIRTR